MLKLKLKIANQGAKQKPIDHPEGLQTDQATTTKKSKRHNPVAGTDEPSKRLPCHNELN